jgi:hypothetical protein
MTILRRVTIPIAIVVACLTMAFAPLTAQQPVASLLFSRIDRELGAIAPQSNLLIAEFRGSACSTIHGLNADTSLAIASVFKLYVLGELARQVQLVEAQWTDTIVLTDALRSMPSGDYAYQPAGTRVSVQSLAEAMIWVSDNTATDHLIGYLGRENVQRAFQAFGQSDYEVNAPLLMTRELFAIKMSQSAAWMAQYEVATADERVAMIAALVDSMTIDPTGGWGHWNGPTAIDSIEWFASASDLCRATASLWSLGAQPGLAPVRDILTGNRGAVWDTTAFPAAGYKGGYEAGVVNATFVLQRSDGRVFFATAGFNTEQGMIDQRAGIDQLAEVFACLAVVDGEGSCAIAEW